MKKIVFAVLLLIGGIMYFAPEYTIFANITTKLVGIAMLGLVSVATFFVFLLKMQRFFDKVTNEMREEHKLRLLKEYNTEIVVPTRKDLAKIAKQGLKFLGKFIIGVLAFIGTWIVLACVIKEYPELLIVVGYTIGAIVLVVVVATAISSMFAPSREEIEKMETNDSY